MIATLLRLKAQLCGQGSRQLRQTTSFQSKPDLAKEFPLRESCGTLAIKNGDIVLVMCLIKIYMKMSIFLENRKMVKMRVKLQYNNCFVAPLKIICFQKYFSCSIYMYNLTTKKKLGCFWSGWGYVNTLIYMYDIYYIINKWVNIYIYGIVILSILFSFLGDGCQLQLALTIVKIEWQLWQGIPTFMTH